MNKKIALTMTIVVMIQHNNLNHRLIFWNKKDFIVLKKLLQAQSKRRTHIDYFLMIQVLQLSFQKEHFKKESQEELIQELVLLVRKTLIILAQMA